MQVQKLLSKHRSDLSAAQQSAGEEARRQLDAYIVQNELALRQIKERLAKVKHNVQGLNSANLGVLVPSIIAT